MSAEVGMVKSGLIHIISELGGWVAGLQPDKESITRSLYEYARHQDMEHLKLLDPSIDDLGEWGEMVVFAFRQGVVGQVLVGRHMGDQVLLGVSNRYGYLAPGASVEALFRVVKFPEESEGS